MTKNEYSHTWLSYMHIRPLHHGLQLSPHMWIFTNSQLMTSLFCHSNYASDRLSR